jgi:hypothetical protein
MADLNKPSFYPRVGNIRPQPRSPLQQAEMRERPLDAAMGALKRVVDRGSELLDSAKATPFDVSRGLINAIPFAGPRLANQFEQSNMSIPVGLNMGSNVPELPFGDKNAAPTMRAAGVETVDIPTKEALNALKWSDVVGTQGAGRAIESLGYGEAPEFWDALDATGVGAGLYGAAKMAPKAARVAGKGAKAGANLVGNAINDAMVYNQGPLAAITPQPMRMFVGPQAKTYDVGRAMKAEEMLKAGASPQDVWKATGTMVGKDGIPRQEISDVGATFRSPDDLKQLKESYKGMIEEGKEKLRPDRSGQKDMFPKQLTEAKKPFREQLAGLKDDLREIDKNPRTQGVKAKWTIEHPELYRAYPELGEIPVTQKPTIGAEKGSLTTLGGVIQDLEVKDIKDPRSVSLHELQHAVQNIEGMAPGANPLMAFSTPEYKNFYETYKKAELAGLPEGTKLSTKDDDRIAQKAAHRWYQLQHGEQEARATQARKDMGPTERQQSYPYNSYDDNPNDLLMRKTVPHLGVRMADEGTAMPDDLQRMREEIRAKVERDRALQESYDRATRGMPMKERPSMEEFRATNAQPSQGELDQMRLELDDQGFAGGGVAKLAKLARAAAKSKAEIEAIAQRVAPQMTGEYVRAGEKSAKTVAGKTKKQFERDKTLEHDIRPTGAERPSINPVDIESLKGNIMMGISGDPTITGQTVYSVAGRPLRSPAPQHGGPLYGLGRGDDSFWASNLGAANNVQNRAREIGQQYDAPVIGNYVMMGPDSYSFAQHFADTNLQNIRPEEMTKAQIEGFNKLVRQGSPKSGPRPSWAGIENPEEAYLQMAVDPELRKHFGNLMQMPTVTEKFGLPSGQDVAHAVTEPSLRDLEIGMTGRSLGLMMPDVTDLKLSEHPTYSHDIPGKFMGSLKYPTPYELMFPDSLKAVRENPAQAPQEFGSFKMSGPRQIIDPQMIDEIKQYEEFVKKYTGKAEGGEITVKPKKMAAGGELRAEDLEIEERPL